MRQFFLFFHYTFLAFHLTYEGNIDCNIAVYVILLATVTEVTPVQPQQPGCINNKIWRKRINQSGNADTVCRTAPATLGLLNTLLDLISCQSDHGAYPKQGRMVSVVYDRALEDLLLMLLYVRDGGSVGPSVGNVSLLSHTQDALGWKLSNPPCPSQKKWSAILLINHQYWGKFNKIAVTIADNIASNIVDSVI